MRAPSGLWLLVVTLASCGGKVATEGGAAGGGASYGGSGGCAASPGCAWEGGGAGESAEAGATSNAGGGTTVHPTPDQDAGAAPPSMPPVASFPNCAVDGAICSPIEACEEDDGDCSAWCNCGDDGVWSCDEACVTSPCPDAPSPGGVCDGPAMLTCTYSPTTAFPNGASCVCGDSDGPLPRHWGCAI